MLNFVMLSVIKVSVLMSSNVYALVLFIVLPSVIALSVFMLNFVMLSVVKVSVLMSSNVYAQ